jgi:hypothetical protein
LLREEKNKVKSMSMEKKEWKKENNMWMKE